MTCLSFLMDFFQSLTHLNQAKQQKKITYE